jgi:hypothetical protein
MARFSELFTPKKFITELGAVRFGTGIFPGDVQRTPHYEMQKAIDAFMYRPQVNSAVKQLALFLTGTNVAFESKDPKTKEFLNAWLEKREDTKGKLDQFITSVLVTGNGYLEFTWKTMKDKSMVLDNFFPITDSSRVYRYLINQSDEDYWIYEVPTELKTYPFSRLSGELQMMRPKFYFINYVLASSTVFRKSVYGIPIHKNKIRHFKNGWSKDMIYGRSFLMSIIDDVEIVREIIKNWSVISRYRALNTKIISIGNQDNRASVEDIRKFEEDLRQKQSHEHILLNKPHEMSSLSNVGEYDDMSNPIEWLRKDVASGLVPNYLTPWNSEVNRATAEEVRIVFQLELESMKDEIINWLNKVIISELQKSYPFINDDATFVFQDVDLEPKSQKMNFAGGLYEQNIITMNEYRKLAGFDIVPNGDKFKKDIEPSQQPPSGGFGESFTEGVAPADTEQDWKTKLAKHNLKDPKETRNYQLSRKANVGGKILRMVKDEPNGVLRIFNSLLEIKDFEMDEREAAEAYFDVQVKKMTELQKKYLQDKTQEDILADDLFSELNRLHGEIVDEFFKELEKHKMQEKVVTSPDALEALQRVMKDFGSRIAGVVKKIGERLFRTVKEPISVPGNDTTIEMHPELERDLEQKSNVMLHNMEEQIKDFNNKQIEKIRRKIADGIAAGKTHQDIRREIKEDISNYKKKDNVQAWEIRRIVRTEIGKQANLLKLVKWKEQGFTHYLWNTMQDERVRPAAIPNQQARQKGRAKYPYPDFRNHYDRNQKVFLIEDALSGRDIFPGGSLNTMKPNINCRCSATLWL